MTIHFTYTHFSETVEPLLATNMKPFCRLFVLSDSVADRARVRSGQQHTSLGWDTFTECLEIKENFML